jgi:hypothetical protein
MAVGRTSFTPRTRSLSRPRFTVRTFSSVTGWGGAAMVAGHNVTSSPRKQQVGNCGFQKLWISLATQRPKTSVRAGSYRVVPMATSTPLARLLCTPSLIHASDGEREKIGHHACCMPRCAGADLEGQPGPQDLFSIACRVTTHNAPPLPPIRTHCHAQASFCCSRSKGCQKQSGSS